jgi:hypothetical protein
MNSQQQNAQDAFSSLILRKPTDYSDISPVTFQMPRGEYKQWLANEEARTLCHFTSRTSKRDSDRNLDVLERERKGEPLIKPGSNSYILLKEVSYILQPFIYTFHLYLYCKRLLTLCVYKFFNLPFHFFLNKYFE